MEISVKDLQNKFCVITFQEKGKIIIITKGDKML